jgi:hypothetical protein
MNACRGAYMEVAMCSTRSVAAISEIWFGVDRVFGERKQVFAVLRIDHYASDALEAVSVQSVLPTLAEAESEVARLNALATANNSTYFWRATRFFPHGRVKADSVEDAHYSETSE